MEQYSLGAEDVAAGASTWPRRYTIVLLFALATALCYVDRVNISIAIIPLARANGYDAARTGLVLSSFFWGYMWPQMLGGWMADRFGGKRVLAAGVALWSVATFLTPPAAAASFTTLLIMRALLGAGEAINFPAVHSIAARWTISSERARAISLHFSGVAFGTMIALLASPVMILAFGWPSVFYISGALGLVWLVLWWIKAANSPEECEGVSAAELEVIRAGRLESGLAEAIPWGAILREKAVWAIVIAHLCNNFGFYILLLWLPTYLHHTFNVPMARLGLFSVIPYAAAFVMQNFSGWLADTLHKRGMRLTLVRKMLQSTAFALGAPALADPAVDSHSPGRSGAGDVIVGGDRDRKRRLRGKSSRRCPALCGSPDGLVEHVRDATGDHRRRRYRVHCTSDGIVRRGFFPGGGCVCRGARVLCHTW